MSPIYTRFRHVLIPVNLAIRYRYSKNGPSMSCEILRTRTIVQSIINQLLRFYVLRFLSLIPLMSLIKKKINTFYLLYIIIFNELLF